MSPLTLTVRILTVIGFLLANGNTLANRTLTALTRT